MGNKDLNSLQEFILPMRFLKTNDVVISSKACEISMFPFPGALRGIKRAEEPSRIPRNASEASILEYGHMYFQPTGLAALPVVEEHPSPT